MRWTLSKPCTMGGGRICLSAGPWLSNTISMSADSSSNSRRFLTHSDPTESATTSSSVTKLHRQSCKYAIQNSVENNLMVRQDNVDDVVYLNSTNVLVQSTSLPVHLLQQVAENLKLAKVAEIKK